MYNSLNAAALEQLFTHARTHNVLGGTVTDEQLHKLYDLTKFGPTAANSTPARFVFIKSEEAKKRLEPFLDEGNREKTMKAPVNVIVAYDEEFYDKLPYLFPHVDARSWFVGNQPLIETASFRNGSMQGAYMILAARALGLDTGPMSGFDNAGVDKEFFAGTKIKSNFLINLGEGDPSQLFPRSPRLPFDEAAQIL